MNFVGDTNIQSIERAHQRVMGAVIITSKMDCADKKGAGGTGAQRKRFLALTAEPRGQPKGTMSLVPSFCP